MANLTGDLTAPTRPFLRVLEQLWEDGEVRLSRCWPDGGPAPVLVVTPVHDPPPAALVKRLEQEYALRAELDPPWAACPVELRHEGGQIQLVLADPGGQLLGRITGRPFEIVRFLRLAIQLAAALGHVHRRGLIHKDVKPAHVLVDGADQVWLTGFGLASRLPRERSAPAPPEVIAGTLAYMAPEQTGRMNRSIDARSDLYSLGITFYEMLTGTLPFTAADPMEWVHCHIARQPVPPDEQVSGIPGPLSAIVMKLLAKTAEERYQTAAGVETDLRRCLTDWEAHGRIVPFPLGAHDVADRLLIPEKLYGREGEIGSLLASFARVVAHGTLEFVLVSGYSGVGKSSVVNELHKALVPPRGLFAAGKFDQYKRDIPYATMAQAFHSLVRQILSKSEAELCTWRAALHEALGPNGRLIVNLIPELELVIGKQPAVPDLPPRDAQNRFQMVFRRFLGVFARPEHPLALFLDDLQWLDTATLDLLGHLATHSEVRHLLLVGAYRDNEVGSAHPLLRTLEAIRNAGARVQEIVLAPLRIDDVGRLVADTLYCAPDRARPLAQLVHRKTSGNPFFVIQFFTALAEEGLLSFDPAARAWHWDLERIRAANYTDNVVEFMAEKLKRLPPATRQALKRFACLGDLAEIVTLTRVHGLSEEELHAALWKAVHAGLILRLEGAYKFLHDRIQQAAYSLIPEARRARAHLRIGRVLLATMTAGELAEHPFDVASQLNRGAARIIGRKEKAQVATLDLDAGRKAKASAAYASACVYLAAGMALLDEKDWSSRYQLMFNLWLECAECEYLTGDLDKAEQLISELLLRAASRVDQAAVYRLKILLHIVKSDNPQAVESARTCLRLFGVDIPAHPTQEQVQAEYETVWQTLDGRPIEGLIDLPLVTDPEHCAAMRLLSGLLDAAYFTDSNLFCLLACRMVNVSLRHGTSGASAHAFGWFGALLGHVFHRYREGYRFTKLACDLVDKHRFLTYQARVYFALGTVTHWSQPIAAAIDITRASFRIATETGDLAMACYCMIQSVASLLLRNDPLDAVWRESEKSLDFARKAGFRDVEDGILSQQRFIATMQGRTATFGTLSGPQFDEAAFEAQLTGNRMTTMVCVYWLFKLKARFLAGEYAQALAAADKAKPLLWAAVALIQVLDYFYYTALTVAALYENASADEQAGWRDLLAAHQERLREWAENYPPTFGDKHALVAAELARLEVRDLDAMRLYEEAIRAARENGFVQNEGLAHEVAAGFYAARGFETTAHAYLRNARSSYLRWGANGKVRQLDQRYPWLREETAPSPPTGTIGAPVEQLDVGTVLKASQAVSGEIVLGTLIETLLRIAVEHAGAERGLLILFPGDEPRIAAEATTGRGQVEVTLRQAAVSPAELPEPVLHYVIRARESVILDDAAAPSLFSADPYVRERRPRSVLCLPLVKQAKLVGALYLENNLTSHAFPPSRIAVLELLASQAAISLENAALYADLQRENADRKQAEESLRRSEAFLAEGQRISHTGSWRWNIETGKLVWSEEHYRIFGVDLQEAEPTFQLLSERLHPEDRVLVEQALDQAIRYRTGASLEFRIVLPDGTVKYLHGEGRPVSTAAGDVHDFVGTTMDITERTRAEEALRNAQAGLARAARLTTMGELAASIAHEINQPLAAIVANSQACLNWLAAERPNLDEARQAAHHIVSDGLRAGDIIRSVRALARKSGSEMTRLDINGVIREVLDLTRGEFDDRHVALEAELSSDLAPIFGDRVQLQQVILNLIMNGIDAMSADRHEPRRLRLRSQRDGPDTVLIAVEDSGPGLAPEAIDHLFEAFFTTKPGGMGMGLSICRSIVEAHGGRLWASPRSPRGAVFQFTVPTAAERLS